MPISIVGLDGAARPVPVVSALVEFGSALHVLRDPGHHGADGWAAGVRASMSPRLAGWTESWWWTTHWSLDPRWETPEAGRLLSRGGVAAARHLPGDLLLHRFRTVRDALLEEFGRFTGQAWGGTGQMPGAGDGIGALAQRAWTVPGQPAFWHAAIHLNQPLTMSLPSGHSMTIEPAQREPTPW